MKINVTKTYLPPLEEYVEFLKKIWDNSWITNHGQFVTELETRLKKYLDIPYLYILNNGTTGLQIAIKALNLKGEIITTPFSYVATVSSIVWENCTPVFVDIDPNTLCIDPSKIEAAITKKTTAIMPVHVYGNQCDVEKIGNIAKNYNLKVIYDAAHAFGVTYKGKSILRFGDISMLSFHATKLFHTVEGGSVSTSDSDIAHKLSYLRNFGHKSPEEFYGLGINGKNTEIHAAMGLCILPRVKQFIKRRKILSERYDKFLKGTGIKRPKIRDSKGYNYAYYPVIFKSEQQLLQVVNGLNEKNIFPRRYFFPSLDDLNYVKKSNVPVSQDLSKRVLCMPLYNDLKLSEVKRIAKIVLENL